MHPANIRIPARLFTRIPALLSARRIKSHPARTFSSRLPIRISLWEQPTFLTYKTLLYTNTNTSAPSTTSTVVMLPNHRLLARAFHRLPSSPAVSASSSRRFSASATDREWEGRKAEENTSREKDSHNVQHDAVKEGKAERAKGEGSRGTTESSEGSNQKAKEEFPEAPDTIGMQDERGGPSK